MRKYRTGGFFLPFLRTGSVTDMLKSTNFVYFFIAWNVFAYCAYRWYEEKKVKDKEEWKQMTSSKYTNVDVAKPYIKGKWLRLRRKYLRILADL